MSIRRRSLWSIIATALMLPAPPALAQSLEGRWLGTGKVPGGVSCWINHRKADGKYEVEFLMVNDAGSAEPHREEGIWFSANGLFVTVTQRIDGNDVDPADRRFREVYRIVELSDRRFVYTDITTGELLSVTRVSDMTVLGTRCPAKP